MIGPAAKEPWGPVSDNERIKSLDIIRGFALLGVILMNLEGYFRAPFARFQLHPHPWPGFLNRVTDFSLQALLAWKAMSLYAFLFGVGLAIQFVRTHENPEAFRRFALRRMAALLAVGALHVTLVFDQDILMPYALCGMLTALFYARLKPRTLALLGCCWIVATLTFVGWTSTGSLPTLKDLAENVPLQIQETLNDNLHSSWWASIGLRWSCLCGGYPGYLLQGVLYAHGLMLLGLAAWKAGVFTDIALWQNRARLITWTILPAAVLLNMLIWLIPDLHGARFNLCPLWATALFLACIPLLALGYAAGLWRVANNPKWQCRLASVAAIGRMGLTNYLLHSLVLSWVFYGYGLGLFDRFGSFVGTVLIGLSLFILMACWSPWWLNRFRFGPAEWLWRSMTYGEFPTFKLRTAHVIPANNAQEPTARRTL
jgi:uncharacterized protein